MSDVEQTGTPDEPKAEPKLGRRRGIGRRRFLLGMVAGTGALCVYGAARSMSLDERSTLEMGDIEGAFKPNAFITITPDDRVIFACTKAEMGQGTMTGQAMLIAEELEVPLEKIEIYFADSAKKYTALGPHITGGSTGISGSYVPAREVAAATRMMLVSAAAQKWGVSEDGLRAEAGRVVEASGDRSVTYGELVEIANTLKVPEKPKLKARKDFRVIGTPARRVDNHAKVTGTAEFGIDVQVPNMAKAVMLHPPRTDAKALSVDADDAKKMPGVVDVVTTERGVGVVAEKYWQALRAAAAVKVEWSEGEGSKFSTSALWDELRSSERSRARDVLDEGKFDEAQGTLVEAVYEVPYLAHAPMEPMNAVAHVTDEGCEVWTGNQGPILIQEAVARILDIERSEVLVHTPFLGGAFGRRSHPEAVLEAAWLSKAVGRPVQIIWSRESDTRGGRYRPLAWSKVQARVDDAGTVTGLSYDTQSQSILADLELDSLFPMWIPLRLRHWIGRNSTRVISSNVLITDVLATEGATNHAYAIPNQHVTYTPFATPFTASWWRSVGFSINSFVIEGFIDELAHAANKEPLAFRRSMLAEAPRWLGVLDAVAELSGWGERTLAEGTGRGIAVAEAFGSFCAQVVEARVDDGQIVVDTVYCVLDCGLAVNPDLVAAQMEGSIIFGLTAAIWGEITVEGGVVQQGNFDTYRLMRMHETPTIVTKVMEGADEPGGVGEPAVAPLAGALANAIFDVSGKRLRRAPLQNELARQLADTTL
ncbi:MAG: molybdopterin cofactor-binding domain-containing protein [Myxococcota bacterium]